MMRDPVAHASRMERPWGSEIFVRENEFYAIRIFQIHKGARVSLHFHTRKVETLYVDRGSARYWITRQGEPSQEFVIHEGDVIEHYPMEVHRQEALEDLRLIEVSTLPWDDIVRVEDDYGRAEQSPASGTMA